MQQGAPFAAVARQFSASATAAAGGDAGWISTGEMAPEVDAALEQMRPGQLSQPIQVRDGVYIIYLREKRAGSGASLVSLKQAAVALPPSATEDQVAAATATLETLRGQVTGCGDLEAKAASVQRRGRRATWAKPRSRTCRRPSARRSKPCSPASSPSRSAPTPASTCWRSAASAPTAARPFPHEQIENRLYGQQLSMIARRYMRDLRTSATIETR